MKQDNKLASGLYVVATPIGNLDDITERARETLENADVIAAEDTRVTLALLRALGIEARGRVRSYHMFNEKQSSASFVETILSGGSVALVSDAGSPCVSDPGRVLIEATVNEGFDVVPVCGACAVTAALSISGFDCGSYSFRGFFPRKESESLRLLKSLTDCGAPPVSVFFESPFRVKKTIAMFANLYGEARACLCNDLTKKHERIYRGTPNEILEELTVNSAAEKGEYTLIVDISNRETRARISSCADESALDASLAERMKHKGISAREAAEELRFESRGKISKKSLYSAVLRQKRKLEDTPENSTEKTTEDSTVKIAEDRTKEIAEDFNE